MLDSPCEAVWVQIHTCNRSSMLLSSFYCPPQSPVSVWDDLAGCVSQLRQQFPGTTLLLGGDFNYLGIDWNTGNLTDSYLPASFRKSLIKFAQDFLLEQVVFEPTRGNHILDLCLLLILALYINVKLYLASVITMLFLLRYFANFPLTKNLRSDYSVIIEQIGFPFVKK